MNLYCLSWLTAEQGLAAVRPISYRIPSHRLLCTRQLHPLITKHSNRQA
uniref:Uncharacterized protein n=1 Tax=Arundo donax TaxID=35708 RepID=A0A0A9HX77_ARUDO